MGASVGLVLAAYGTLSLWLNRLSYDDPVKRRFCEAWLCPEGFWDAHHTTPLQEEIGNPAKALGEFKRALALDPASAYRWADLGDSQANLNDIEGARYSFRRALTAGPGSPGILFRAANFDFRMGEYGEAMHKLSAILRNPELTAYYAPVFLTYSKMDLPLTEILENGIPRNPVAAEGFLRFWMEDSKVEEAEETWNWMTQEGLSSDSVASSYTDFLLANKEFDLAAETWAKFNSKTDSAFCRTNWLYNGGFETNPRNSLFDWHIESTGDVTAGLNYQTNFRGEAALQLEFEGKTNIQFSQVFTHAVVTPGPWLLSVFAKSLRLTTDQGVAIHIFDVEDRSRLDVQTAAVTGTHDWFPVEKTFDVGGETRFVRVEVRREKSRESDDKISGTLWLDEFQLSPVR